MPKHIDSVMQTAYAALLVAIVVMLCLVTGRSAWAAGDCLAAPNSDAPQGHHWYYHTDRAKHRKCWYLGLEGQKVLQSAPHSERAAAPLVPLGRETAGDQLTPSGEAERPTEPAWPAPAPVDAMAFRPALQPPAAAKPAEATEGNELQVGAPVVAAEADTQPSMLQSAPMQAAPMQAAPVQAVPVQAAPAQAGPDETAAPSRVAAVPETEDSVTPGRLFLLVAPALAFLGFLLWAGWKIAGARRRRVYVDRRATHLNMAPAHERPSFDSAVAPPCVPEEDGDPFNYEETLRQILRTLERRAA
jgi:hypothetical protein